MPITEFSSDDIVVSVEEHDDPGFDRELDAVAGLMRYLSDDDWIAHIPDLVVLPNVIRLA